jgi:hypothetical protein
MTTAVLVAAVLVGVLACPAIMWWQHRRGRSGPCCPPVHGGDGGGAAKAEELTDLRRRQAVLAARLYKLDPRSSQPVHADSRDGD